MLAAIEALAENPRPPSCKKLVGQDTWRIRVANTHRVIHEIHEAKDFPMPELTVEDWPPACERA